MAFIYTVDLATLKLKHYTSVNVHKTLAFGNNLVSIEHRDTFTSSDFESLLKDYPHSDTYHTKDHNIYTDIHRHDDDEARLILHGVGWFYIPDKTNLLVVRASEGDLIKVAPKVDHWFGTSGELSAIRFFSDEHGHVSLKPSSTTRQVAKAYTHFEKGNHFTF